MVPEIIHSSDWYFFTSVTHLLFDLM